MLAKSPRWSGLGTREMVRRNEGWDRRYCHQLSFRNRVLNDRKSFDTLRIPAATVCNYDQFYSNMRWKLQRKITVLDSYNLHFHPKKERQVRQVRYLVSNIRNTKVVGVVRPRLSEKGTLLLCCLTCVPRGRHRSDRQCCDSTTLPSRGTSAA